jgi:Ankyrin repeats (many copies)
VSKTRLVESVKGLDVERFEGAKALAEYGANVNYQDPKNGKTALFYGVEKEFDPTLLKWLVKHGASPDIADHDGVSPRLKASRKRDKGFAEAISKVPRQLASL